MNYYRFLDIVFESETPIIEEMGLLRYSDGSAADPRPFVLGNSVVTDRLLEVDVSFLVDPPPQLFFGPHGMLIADAKVGHLIASLCAGDVQCVPLIIPSLATEHVIVNILRSIECVDEQRSVLEQLPLVQRKRGRKYNTLLHLFIEASKVAGSHLFRVAEWQIAVVVSEQLRELLESHNVSGLVFDEAS